MYIFLLTLIIFLSYLELSPKLGNVWYRLNSQNKKIINIASIINFILYPLYNINFWYINNWDLNFFIYYLITKFINYFILNYNLINYKIIKKKVSTKLFCF
jgi:hypothetical protein